ncbi:hypothetical protein DSO57_1013263 [Entomophthora muscae]|uniref:Uncharacterized protein n=1 Tax=Entomophthora muscae TaxID=34485 RepID=A0ACC2T5U8_9FUNG|nr:hypothetical protein DSO57_1013263 [Entomophthora muscae]
MTLPLTPRPDHPLEPTITAETASTQLFGVLYITLTGLIDSMVPNSGSWLLLRQSVSYIIKLAPILWWALPTGSAAPHSKPPNTSTYDWIPDTITFSEKDPLEGEQAPNLMGQGPSVKACNDQTNEHCGHEKVAQVAQIRESTHREAELTR